MKSSTPATARRRVALLLVMLLAASLLGCAASKQDVQQFQDDHREFRSRLAELDQRMRETQAQIDSLTALLGGNVSNMLRTMRADQSSVSSELGRHIETLSVRMSENEERMQRLMQQLDTFNRMAGRIISATPGMENADASEAQRLFQQAREDYQRGEHEVARMGFQQIVELYPQTVIAGDALYFVGETHMAQSRPDSARQAFLLLEETYPESTRLPAALLKRAIIRQNEGDLGGARRLLGRIINDYPNSDEVAQARLRLAQLER